MDIHQKSYPSIEAIISVPALSGIIKSVLQHG